MPAAELLQRYRTADLLRFTTAGSVDDGKSTLIGRLLHDSRAIFEDQLDSIRKASAARGSPIDLAFVTDGLKAEREQGITIDVAYRYFHTLKRRYIIIDTPGHEQYTRNMVTGASNADLAVVLVDARKGVLTQSKRHGFIASLLGIRHVVLAVNKMDLVGYRQEVFEDICRQYAQFAAKLGVHDLTFIPLSALQGDAVVEPSRHMDWYRGPTLLGYLETVHIAGDRNLIDLRFPVQYVLRADHDFRGYCGQLAGGVIRKNDEVMVLPSGKTTRVARIVTYDGELEYAFPPQSITVCLADELDVGRGDMLVHPGNLPRTARTIEAMLVWMDEQPLDPSRTYLFKHTTALVRGQFVKVVYRTDPDQLHRQPAASLALNEIGRVEVELATPIFCDEYARNRRTGSCIVIDPLSNRTVGVGMCIERSIQRGLPPAAATSGTVSRNIVRHVGHVTEEDRRRVLRQQPCTLWLTGLSGSGKSTIAYTVEKRLMEAGHTGFVLDGDNVRHGLNRDLGFSPQDRAENIRRVAEVARLLNEAGLIVVTALISPYREDRRTARTIIGEERFIEVLIDAPLSLCEARDVRGLYRKARAGEISAFTGVSAPYEPPAEPHLHLHTDRISAEDAADAILAYLRARKFLAQAL